MIEIISVIYFGCPNLNDGDSCGKFPVKGSVSAQFTFLLDASFRQSNKKPPKKHKTSRKGERTMKLENGELKQKLHPNNFLKEKYTSVNICISDERSEDIYKASHRLQFKYKRMKRIFFTLPGDVL